MRRVGAAIASILLAGCTALPAPEGRGAEPAATLRPGSFARGVPGGEPCGFGATREDLLVLACSGTLVRVPKGGGATRSQPLEGEVLGLEGLARGASGSWWALLSTRDGDGRAGRVVGVASTGETGRPALVGASVPMGAAEVDGRLWVGMLDGRLVEVLRGAARTVARASPILWVRADGSSLWTVAEDGVVTLRDVLTGGARSTFGAPPEPIAAETAFGSLWVATEATITRMDPDGTRAAIAAGATVNDIEPCGSRLWVSQPDLGVRSITPEGTIGEPLRLAVAPRYLSCDAGILWILTEDGRIGSIGPVS